MIFRTGKRGWFSFIFIPVCFFFINGCLREKFTPPVRIETFYPDDVAAIITTKCAVSGCHNPSSYQLAGNLDFSTHGKMFNGNNLGAVVIPFRPDQSPLLFYVNVDSTLGIVQQPAMPVNSTPLSRSEYFTLRNWIYIGAPDKNGNDPFADNPFRKKFYVANSGCDLLSVFDSEKKVIMRCYDLGTQSGIIEASSEIKFTPDGKYYLIDFLNSDKLQVFDASTDNMVTSITIGSPGNNGWGQIAISGDSKTAYVASSSGNIVFVDIASAAVTNTVYIAASLHALELNPAGDTLFAALDPGNYLYKIPVHNSTAFLSFNLHSLIPQPTALNIHDIIFISADRFALTCAHANQLWIMDANTVSLIDTFHTGATPQQLAISDSYPYLFITCENSPAFSGTQGSVEVYNYLSLTRIKTIKAGIQPNAIAVDDHFKLAYVANRNTGVSGHGSHHASTCGGGKQNGDLTFINLETLETLPQKPELSVDPRALAIRP